ncbi:MAG: OmpA family protein [Alphaproteobacteria bacterium]|nr:OmpA family protein [Alphaproteobacteria bacterium]
MKLRTIVLAGIAAAAIAGPAAASDATGWYLGLGAGWDTLGSFHVKFQNGGPTDRLTSSDTGLFLGTVGYRLPLGLRLEMEIGWDRHDVSGADVLLTPARVDGRISNLTGMVNAIYDWHLTPQWDLSLGMGAGIDRIDLNTNAGGFAYADGRETGYGYQGLVGVSYSITDNVDLSLDWRYRSFSVDKNFGTAFGAGVPFTRFGAHLNDNNEQAVMFGVRWYPASEPPPPPPPVVVPPPPPPPPPPAPPPPPPVKTFIVFFDFNKSNLTAEAEAVVTEAVKTAKQQGAVRILVTGHTDTVGSHSYNQSLSERRAASVKEEMVHQGMNASDIGTVGRSFDEPLVPTGPGVREPQNRRAVIDLGGGS